MPFEKPGLSDLRSTTRADFQARLPGADALLRQSNIRVAADVQAALVHGTYQYLGWLAAQLLPDSADGEFVERWAAIFGLERKAAAKAAGSVVFSGLAGSAILENLRLRAGDGTEFTTLESGVIAGSGDVTLAVEAVTPGKNGVVGTGVMLQLIEAVPGVDGTALVTAGGTTGGVDQENDESLRARLLFRIQMPPQGGAFRDYEAWALAMPGVTRVWPSPGEMGAGTVTVRFMMDDLRTAHQGIPQGTGAPDYTGDQADLLAFLEPLRPVTAQLFVEAPVAVPLNVTITGLSPDTPAVRAAIEAEVADMIRRDAVPGETIYFSRLIEAVSVAAGEAHHKITSPVDDVVHGVGEIAVMGTITYA